MTILAGMCSRRRSTSHRVVGYSFDGYWEDIGTIGTFYHANLALTEPSPPFSFHDPVNPIYTRPRFLPGSRIYGVNLDRVKLADGCVIEGAEIQNAVIGIRSIIGEDVILRHSIMMGADYYEGESKASAAGAPPMGIGRGSRIEGAIIDKNARIGQGVVIEPHHGQPDIDTEAWSIRDGIVVIPKHAVLPDGTQITPGIALQPGSGSPCSITVLDQTRSGACTREVAQIASPMKSAEKIQIVV